MSDSIDFPPEMPEIMSHVGIVAYRAMLAGGVDHDKAEVCAREIADSAWEAYAGGQMYIPLALTYRHLQRDEKIYAEFNGNNMLELVQRYKLSDMAIRKILKRQREREAAKRQGDLFPGNE